ncbi:MAG: hypothetical protein M3N41_08595 [Acidobacteriota bacterium]|nr:hypothetical protein [Acidobacteriota bacterium]
MSTTFSLLALGFILVLLYALRRGRDVRAGLKILGATIFFETSENTNARTAKKLAKPTP